MSRARMSIRIAAVALLLVTPACEVVRTPYLGPDTIEAGRRLTPAEVGRSVEAVIDRSVDPCADFYQFACGSWLKRTPIPPDRSRVGRSFSAIQDRNQVLLRDLLEEAVRAPGGAGDTGKLGRFYASCMDGEAIERFGVDPLQQAFGLIEQVQDLPSLVQVLGSLRQMGVEALFETQVFPDFANPAIEIAQYFQGGLGLPERSFYLDDDPRSRSTRAAYQAHVEKMLRLSGVSGEEAGAGAAGVLALETRLAAASLPRDLSRDLDRIYHRLDRAGLAALAPSIPWDAWFEAIGDPGLEAINVGMPDYFKALGEILPATPMPTLRAYLRFRLLSTTAGELPRAFVDEDFDFYSRILSGQQRIAPRWKRCVDATDEAVGDLLGRRFVERAFGGDSRERASAMLRAIEAALGERFAALAWMDGATRERAAAKLQSVDNKIGYPDRWRDQEALDFRSAFFLDNMRRAVRFEFRRQQDKIGRPTDRDDWGMTPPTVNAAYDPTLNEMVFPAGVLQPPLFHRDFPRAMNYGGMGMGMGHELTHGFDDQGRKFDGTGQMRPWWEPEVVGRFEERAACVEGLYGRFTIEPGLALNGRLTLGENIADLGGLREAWSAYQASIAAEGPETSPVPGLTPAQLFFVAFAQTWCEVVTPEQARVLGAIDPHAPGRFRVNGAAMSLPAFAETFTCAPDAPMNPVSRCEVW
ncbi:MAG TPA: M13 family metallopeptidase [Dongiaceae bacterium]|nr:M13 family metallopeptidase [Dongiaceae bacterium]